jgi:hypothetical protein
MPLTHEELLKDSLYRYIANEVSQAQQWLEYRIGQSRFDDKFRAAETRYKYWFLKLLQYTDIMNNAHDNRPLESKFNAAMQMDGSF